MAYYDDIDEGDFDDALDQACDNGEQCECATYAATSLSYHATYIAGICRLCNLDWVKPRCLADTKAGAQCKKQATDGRCADGSNFKFCVHHAPSPYDDPLFMAAAAQAANEMECR